MATKRGRVACWAALGLSVQLALGAGLPVVAHAQPAAANALARTALAAKIDEVQPMAGGKALVAPLTAVKAGAKDRWVLKLDLYVENTGSGVLDADKVRVTYQGSSAPSAWEEPVNVTIGVGQTQIVQVLDGFKRDLVGPVPDSATVTVEFAQNVAPLTTKLTLAAHKNPAPNGAYFFPAKAGDLGKGQYWSWRTRHMGAAPGVTWTDRNRFAYDMGVSRWDKKAKEWTGLREGADPGNPKNADYLVWDKPVYAMADGKVMYCREDVVDHEGSGGGPANSVWIDHGGEFAGYVHLKLNSIPSSVCPQGSEKKWGMNGKTVTVKAGQLIGRVGNTGNSSAPHLHLEVLDGVPPGNPGASPRPNGLPVLFQNALVRGDRADVDPDAGPIDWTTARGQAIGWNALVLPNRCGFDVIPSGLSEWARHGITAACFQDVVNRATAAGYEPAVVDGYTVGGNTYFNAVFQPKDQLPSATRHGLTAAQLDKLVDEWGELGYRIRHLDGYQYNGMPRYVAIFVKDGGPRQFVTHSLSSYAHQAVYNLLTGAGWRPVINSGVSDHYLVRYFAVYEQRSLGSYRAEWAIPEANYQEFAETQLALGRRPLYLNAYNHGGKAYLSAIYTSTVPGPFEARHGLTAAQYQAEYDTWVGKKYRTRQVTGYASGTGHRFAAVWRP
ncbi:MAG: peptidoglycan DD-metalloendopeptidase family protein [Thermocrispum agreste]|uniref:Peptidoglycan DD-metalloendopeptidase family protein n=1 Tax=Thermocrispum agreste TaxID=37925 RepID=A0ABD6FGJ5_9PSEU